MTAPQPVQHEAAEQQAVAVIAALLAAGTTLSGVLDVLRTLPQLAGLTADMLAPIAGLIPKTLPGGRPTQGRSAKARIRQIGMNEIARARAAYVVRAAGRLATAAATGDPATYAAAKSAERRYRAHHEAMSRQRAAALNVVVRAAGYRKPDTSGRMLMSWNHRGQEPPCPQCAPHVGKNFDALKPPLAGYPGMVHPHDFCFPGPPLP